MKFFKRLVTPSETSHAHVPSLGSGRRLRSGHTLTECIANLEAILLSYRPPIYPQMPPYVFPGWWWNGSQEQFPNTVIFFEDSNNDFLLVAFWPDRNGTECGLFPLGSGDERLSAMPIIGHWKQRDASLTSIGVVPGGQITLAPPHVPDQFFDEILRTAGFPSTPGNIEKIRTKIGDMFLLKAHQFISSDDPGSADRFVQSHRYAGNSSREFCQSMLDDLAALYPNLLPYIQDLPMRCRAIVLEAVDYPSGSMWEEYER